MWQQKENSTESNVAEKKNYDNSEQYDSGIVDSGFLSSAGNLLTSCEITCEIKEDKEEEQHQEKGKTAAVTVDESNTCGQASSDIAAGGPNEAIAPEQMRADSGLDLVLTESLSQLSIKHININPLGRTKVQTEPIIQLKPISTKIDDIRNCRNNNQQQQQQQYSQEPWELYYTQDEDGDTQLHISIVQGFLEAAFSLIRMAPHPCLLNILNDDCQAPLHLAVLTRQPRIARRLVLAGANPTVRDFRGNTPLHLACASGDIASAKALTDPLSHIERNFLSCSKRVPALPQDLEQRNYDGEMCLHVAASGDQVDLVQHLLRLGADLEAREALSGRTALHLALERGCHSVVTFLLQECRPCLDAPTYAGTTAYQIAICLDSQLARELVRLGATPEPMVESDSEMSDEDDDDENDNENKTGDKDASYLPAITRLRQSVGVGV